MLTFKKTTSCGVTVYDTDEGTFEGRGGTAVKLRIARNRRGKWDLLVRFEGDHVFTGYARNLKTKADAKEHAEHFFGWSVEVK